MRVGLVPGAGGVLGGAWLVGALDGACERDRLGPRGSHYMVGTAWRRRVGLPLGIPAGNPFRGSAGMRSPPNTEGLGGLRDRRRHPLGELDQSARVAPLVVVPGNHLDLSLVDD